MSIETNSDRIVASVTTDTLDSWATDLAGPVALHLKQKLLAVEDIDGSGSVIFPPTYADIGYNIDTLADGIMVATIDSLGSQANRLEPIFKLPAGAPRDRWLVPQIDITLHTEDCGECDACKGTSADDSKKKKSKCLNPYKEKCSILELAHRSADAVVQSSPRLAPLVQKAFQALHKTRNAELLCAIVPTSLVFGVWDSRGGTGEKRPRLVRSIIRAWDVQPLHSAAQFNSVWKALDDNQQGQLEKEAKAKKCKLSEKGFADAPAVFRKTDKIPKYLDGAPNPDARVLGGVAVNGRIEREMTVNLVALRNIHGKTDDETKAIRRYLLGLSLLAAVQDIDLFLREGCHLRYTGDDIWYVVPRRGDPAQIALPAAKALISQYAENAAKYFRERWLQIWPDGTTLEYEFDLDEAKKLLAKKSDEDSASPE